MLPLPVETLSELFSWATYSLVREVESIVDYPKPFEYIEQENDYKQIVNSLSTKRALSLVCRRWRTICARFLFECITFNHRTSALGLVCALESQGNPGTHVKWIFIRQYTSTHPTNLTDQEAFGILQRIFEACPNIKIISLEQYPLSASGGSFDPTLLARVGGKGVRAQRLDLLAGCRPNLPPQVKYSPVYDITSASVLSTSLDLALRKCDVPSGKYEDICLANLHTLRISRARSKRRGFRVPLSKMRLPSLRRLVVWDFHEDWAGTEVRVASIIKSNASRIRCFEVSSIPTTRNKILSSCLSYALRYCTDLEEIYFPLLLLGDPWGSVRGGKVLHSLKHIGIHIAPNDDLRRENGSFGRVTLYGAHAGPTAPNNYEEWTWERLFDTFTQFTTQSTIFPSLGRISLHGIQWLTYIRDTRFVSIMTQVEEAGIVLLGFDNEVEAALRGRRQPL